MRPKKPISDEQKAEWDQAFASATGRPPVRQSGEVDDPDAARIYGVIGIAAEVFGALLGLSCVGWSSTIAISVWSAAAVMGWRFSRLAAGTTFGRTAWRGCLWLMGLCTLLQIAVFVQTVLYARLIQNQLGF